MAQELDEQQLSRLQALKSSNPDGYSAFLAKHNMPDPFEPAGQQGGAPTRVEPNTMPPQDASQNLPTIEPQNSGEPTTTAGTAAAELAKLVGSNPFLAPVMGDTPTQPVDIFDHVIARLGMDLTPEQRNASTLAKIIDDYANLNGQKAEMDKVNTSMSIINQNLGALPASVQNIVSAALQNPDESYIESLMRGYLEQHSVDFSKPFDKQDRLQMINKFVADAPYASLEDIPETALANLTSVAKNIYSAKQREVSSATSVNPAEILNARTQKFNASVDASLSQLDKLGGILTSNQKQEIASLMYSKGSGVLFDAEGNYTSEAAMMLTWAKYGPSWMDQTASQAKSMIEAAKRQGAEEALSKGLFPYDAPPRPMGVPVQNTNKDQGRQAFKQQVNSALGKG